MGKLKVGSACQDITPDRPAILAGSMWVRESTGVINPVYTGAVVIDNGDERLVFLSCDLCLLSDEIHDRLRREIAGVTGTKPELVAVSCTHTHNGPSVFRCIPDVEVDSSMSEEVFSRIVRAATDACSRLAPAEMGYGRRRVRATFNRRLVVKGGKVIMSPGPQDPPVITTEGPADEDLQVIWFRKPTGEIISVLINFSAHCTLSLGENKISADFPGVARRIIREKTGDIPVLYFQGAAGNTSPIDFTVAENLSSDRLGIMEKTGKILGDSVLDIINEKTHRICTDITLGASHTTIQAPARHAGREDLSLKDARKYLEEHPVEKADKTDINTMLDRYFAEWVVRLEGARPFRESYPVEVSAYRLGDIAIVTVPAELFVEYQIEIKKRSAFSKTMLWELTNGYCGYVITGRALENGCYEARLAVSSKLSPQAGSLIVSKSIKLIESLKK